MIKKNLRENLLRMLGVKAVSAECQPSALEGGKEQIDRPQVLLPLILEKDFHCV